MRLCQTAPLKTNYVCQIPTPDCPVLAHPCTLFHLVRGTENIFSPPTNNNGHQQNLVDQYFILLLFGGLGVYLLWEAWRTFKEAVELTAQNLVDQARQQIRKDRNRQKNALPLPAMPDDYANKVASILEALGEYDIKLPAPTIEAMEAVQERFTQDMWREMASQAMALNGYKSALSEEEVPETTPYDLLYSIQEELYDLPDAKPVVQLHWDRGDGENTYRDYALALRDLAKGKLYQPP